jgi:hypothetical protein
LALELKGVIDTLLVRREGNSAERGGEFLVPVVGLYSVTYDEAHDFVGVKVRVNIGDLGVRLEGDVLVLVLGEVNNDFPALGH